MAFSYPSEPERQASRTGAEGFHAIGVERLTVGPIADGFIHVHHIRPLSEIGTAYEVDAIQDLRPVCPNCHAMIHLDGQTRSIAEIQQLLWEFAQE